MNTMVKINFLQKTTLQDYPNTPAALVFLAGCNLRCVFCHNPAAVKNAKETVSNEEFFSFLESRKNLLEGVVISGGEPTIHKDLPEFIAKIKKMNFKVKLDSNGTNPEMLEELIKKNLLDYIAMDVKAPYDKYAEITQTKGVTNKIKNSIKIIMKSKVDYEFRTTCHPSLTKKDFEKIVAQIKGAKRFFLQKYIEEVTLDSQRHLAIYSKTALLDLKKQLEHNFDEMDVR